MTNPKPDLSITLDPSNPGQFFACCGFLELADRAWKGADGWFSENGREFHLRGAKPDCNLLRSLAEAPLSSSMTDEESARLKTLKNLKKSLRTSETDAETERLDKKWENERLFVGGRFGIWLDWWSDDFSGGSRLKTWAGKQFISDIVRGLRSAINTQGFSELPPDRWLFQPSNEGNLPLYFDSDIGSHSSSIDVGFSLDKLDTRGFIRPLIELAAFVALQRFRPADMRAQGSFRFCLWTKPLPPLLASVACNGAVCPPNSTTYSFRLLFRTKYLKGFLPATRQEPRTQLAD